MALHPGCLLDPIDTGTYQGSGSISICQLVGHAAMPCGLSSRLLDVFRLPLSWAMNREVELSATPMLHGLGHFSSILELYWVSSVLRLPEKLQSCSQFSVVSQPACSILTSVRTYVQQHRLHAVGHLHLSGCLSEGYTDSLANGVQLYPDILKDLLTAPEVKHLLGVTLETLRPSVIFMSEFPFGVLLIMKSGVAS